VTANAIVQTADDHSHSGLTAPVATTDNVNKDEFSSVVFNLDTPRIRFDQLEGRDHMVVPMIMLTQGVHAGSQGPILYLNEELGKTPAVWNHKPVVVYHPVKDGVGVSACTPVVLNSRKIGIILNSHFKDSRLHAEAWLEVDRVKRIDDRILTALEAGEMVELSTGLFTDNERESGTFEGKEFTSIARNFRPDHLAILPVKTGACSIEDGAGLLRLNNEMSHEQVRSGILMKLREMFGERPWFLEEIFNMFFVYTLDDKMFSQSYVMDETGITLEGPPTEVVRVTEFRTLDGDQFVGNIKESFSMDKKKFVDGLIANSSWEEEDRKFLMGLSEDRLKKMNVVVSNVDPKAKPMAIEPPKNPELVAPVVANAAPKVVSVADYVNNAPAGIRDMLTAGLQSHLLEKAKLIATIVANERNNFSEEALTAMSHADLVSIAFLAQPAIQNVQSQPSFAGLGLDAFTNPTVEEAGEPLSLPVLNFEKK